jgi:outer membrane protein assembly factor BamD (BamD/ComL family)
MPVKTEPAPEIRPEPAVPRDRPAGDLARELAQVRAAGEALRDRQGAAALAAADAYLRTYPGGAFVPEARLHRSEALCLLGRTDEARAAADAFLRELPDSPLRARVRSVCAEK